MKRWHCPAILPVPVPIIAYLVLWLLIAKLRSLVTVLMTAEGHPSVYHRRLSFCELTALLEEDSCLGHKTGCSIGFALRVRYISETLACRRGWMGAGWQDVDDAEAAIFGEGLGILPPRAPLTLKSISMS